MSENQRKIDIAVGTSYNGAGLRSATADVAKFRQELALPAMGPLSREQSMVEDVARKRVRAMEQAAERARVGSRVDELLYGGAAAAPAAKAARFGADEQAIRDQMASRIRVMREESRKANIGDEVSRRLFGEDVAAKKQSDAMRKLGDETDKAKEKATGLLGVFSKFGTSNGLDGLMEKMSKMAPMLGAALAIGKLFAVGLTELNAAADRARHNAQRNLERQLKDDQATEDRWGGIPIAGQIGSAIADNKYGGMFTAGWRKILGLEPDDPSTGFGKARTRGENREYIERLEDETKAQERLIASRQKRLEQDKSLATSSAADLETLRTQFASRGTSPERGAYLQTAAAQAAFNKSLGDLDGGGKNVQEAQEKKAAMAKATLLALFDSVKADGGRVKDLLDGVTGSSKALVAAFKEEFTARQKIEGETRRTRLQSEGRNIEAEFDRIRSEANAAAAMEKNPGNRRAIMEKASADESSLMRNLAREQLNEKRAFDQEMLQSDADVNVRRMRLGGLNFAADKEELKKQYEERLFAIKDEIDRETDARKKADLERRAGSLANAAKAEYDVGSAELAERRRQMFKPRAPGSVSGEIGGTFHGVVGDIDSQRDFMKANVDAAKTAADKLKSIDTNNSALLTFLKGLGVVK